LARRLTLFSLPLYLEFPALSFKDTIGLKKWLIGVTKREILKWFLSKFLGYTSIVILA
jgi:hypothetical protein